MAQIDRTNFNALVDDDGSNTVGTKWNKAQIQAVILDPIDNVAGQTQTTAVTGAQNNFALSTGARLLRCNNTFDVTFSGFAAGVDNQIVIIKPVNSGNVYIKHLNGGSFAVNQCSNIATSGDTPISFGGFALIQYDGTSSLWRLIAHEQGAWIPTVFSAGNFSAGGTQSWTLASGDIIVNRSRLDGRTLLWNLGVATTTVGGSANAQLRATIPGGFTAVGRQAPQNARISDNGGTASMDGLSFVSAANAFVEFYKDATETAVWTAATNTTSVEAMMMIEVQ